MPERDYYADLGIAHNATSEEIGRAFRRGAAKVHPDRNPGDRAAEEKFKRIAEAYNVLNDPKARASYDRGGQAEVQAETGFHGFETTEEIFSRFGDVFGGLFGDRVRREPVRAHGQDYDVELALSFNEAARGGKKTFTINVPTACEACHGSGSSDGRPHPCPTCGGQGYVSKRAQKSGGLFSVTSPCPSCQASGINPASRCPRCRGSGTETRPRTLEVSIPSAAGEGTILRLKGMGAPGSQGGTPGDLMVHLRVRSDGPFQREGLNLLRDLAVDLLTAVLGGKVEVPLLEGSAEMTIPPGTQPGQLLRLSGQGLLDSDGKRGDLTVRIQVRIPRRLSDKERRLFEQLRSAGPG